MCVYDTLYTCARMLLTGARLESFQDAMNSREQTRKGYRLTILLLVFFLPEQEKRKYEIWLSNAIGWRWLPFLRFLIVEVT